MDSLLGGHGIELSAAKSKLANLSDPVLKAISASFLTNYDSLHEMLTMPEHVASETFKLVFQAFRYFSAFRKGGVSFDYLYDLFKSIEPPVLDKLLPPSQSFLQALTAPFPLEEDAEYFKNVRRIVGALKPAFPNIKRWETSQIHSGILLAWSYFESMSTDCWIGLLNEYPATFVHRVTNDIDEKKLPLSLLGKYDFTLKQHMGTILKQTFELTSLKGIKKAFRALLKDRANPTDVLFDQPELLTLSACRHLLVHRAGLIDEEFLKQSKTIMGNINDQLTVGPDDVPPLINSAINAGASLLVYMDSWIQTNAKGA